MSRSAETIQTQMNDLRGKLDHDVEEMVESTKEMFDWRSYVKKYPWTCLGVAAGIGYLLVPRRLELRSPDPEALLELAKRNKLVVQANPQPQAKASMGSTVLRLATNAAMRGLLGYVGHRLGAAGGSNATHSSDVSS